MRVEYKPRTNEYDITVNKDDLLTAFVSEDCFNEFMHNLVKNVYDEQLAEMLFPLKKGDNDES